MSRSADYLQREAGSSRRTAPPAKLEEESELDTAVEAATGTSYDEDRDWRSLSAFGAGLIVGALVGGGVALLVAPRSGADTRELLGDGARRVRGIATDRWDDLRDELNWLAHRGRRKLRRGVTRGRWTAEDVIDKGRHEAGV